MPTQQLQHWQSEFGNTYTDRNVMDWRVLVPAWEIMIGDLQLNNVIEVGCNRGHHLRAIASMNCVAENIVGIEPNHYALSIARRSSAKITALQGDVFSLPFVDSYADVVFTSGVLIHVAPDDLARATDEIHRVTRRYILCIEYFAEQEQVIHYHGHDNLLWKHNFKSHYLNCYSDLTVLKDGYWTREDGFDRTHWWLFARQS